VQKQWEDLKQMKQVKREMKQLFDALKQRGVQMGLDTYGSGGIKYAKTPNPKTLTP
jgi:hypothetical protein